MATKFEADGGISQDRALVAQSIDYRVIRAVKTTPAGTAVGTGTAADLVMLRKMLRVKRDETK